MSILDKLDKAESAITKYQVDIRDSSYFVYEVKLSSSMNILKGSFDFIRNDSKKEKKFFLIINTRYFIPKATTIVELSKIFNDFSDVLFNPKLHKFAIKVKSFVSHRRLIEMLDRIFKKQKASTRKFDYFSSKQENKMMEWLIS